MNNLMNRKILSVFFDGSYEQKLDNYILTGAFADVKNDVEKYVKSIINIPIDEVVEYICHDCKRQPIAAADVFQFSRLEDATHRLCSKMVKANNLGFRFKDVAYLLLDDGVQRNEGALNKYGENHIKTAESFGLAFRDSNRNYYLSAVGHVFDGLESGDRERLMLRLFIRNKLFVQLFIAASQGPFELETFLYDLSESTYIRRRSNINKIVQILNDSDEYDFLDITKNIIY